MKIFVTGSTGFIGSHVVQRLVRDGHQVTCLVRATSDTRKLVDLGITLARGDVTDRASLARGMQGCEGLVHLAAAYAWWAADSSIYHKVNVDGQKNVMEAALEQGISRVVDVSTAGIWGNTPIKPITESTPFGSRRSGLYCETKFLANQFTRELYQTRNLPVVSIYPVGVAGVGDKISYRSTILGLMGGYPGYIYPNEHIPTVHVRDVVEVISRLLSTPGILGEMYLVGNSNPTTREIFDMLCDVAGIPCLERDLPNGLVAVMAYMSTKIANLTKKAPSMEYDAIRFMQDDMVVDGSKATRELNFTYTPIRQAFEEMVAEIREDQRNVQLHLS